MTKINIADVTELRAQTEMSILDVKKALEEAGGDKKAALELLKKRGAEIMEKKQERTAGNGIVEGYVHAGRIGVLVEVNCETDFVARGDDFKTFVHDLALQICSMAPANVEALLEQEWIKDSKKTIATLLADITGKLGERIVIKRFTRMELGE